MWLSEGMNAPICFEGFEDVPELREALIAYLEAATLSLSLHEVCRWLPEREGCCLNLP